jgi:hypothetical protein
MFVVPIAARSRAFGMPACRLEVQKRSFGDVCPTSGLPQTDHGSTRMHGGMNACPGSGTFRLSRRESVAVGRDLFRSDDDPTAKPATPLHSLCWSFRAKRACAVNTDAWPDRLAPLTPPALMRFHLSFNVGANLPLSNNTL